MAMFTMILWFLMCEEMSHLVLGKSARAVPHDDGSGDCLEISSGIEERGKNQVRTPSVRSSVAYTCRAS